MNNVYLPGPGDESTWPDYIGLPNDPRLEEFEEDDEMAELATTVEDLRDWIRMAENAVTEHNAVKALAAINEIRAMLAESE